MRGLQTHENGQKREFFKWICIHFTLTPLIDYRENKTEYTPRNERGDYSMSLCRWKEIKSLAEENDQEWFDKLTETSFFSLYSLVIRKENLEDFKKPVEELERLMLNELRDFLLMDKDFQGRHWSDEPLTDREQALIESLSKNHTQSKKKDLPKYIQQLINANLIIPINGTFYYRLNRPAKNAPKGRWLEQAKKVLGSDSLEVRKWATDGYIRKRNLTEYTPRGLESTIKSL